jgi:hypothetical protein
VFQKLDPALMNAVNDIVARGIEKLLEKSAAKIQYLSLSISVYDIHILSVHICFFSVFLSLVSEWWHRTEQPWSIVFHILENTALRPNTIDVGQRIVKLLAANEAVLSFSLSL